MKLLVDCVCNEHNVVTILVRWSVSMMDATRTYRMLLMLSFTNHAQGFVVSHAEVCDLLVVFAAKANRILVSTSLLVIPST